MDKLPRVFVNKINNEIKNNQEETIIKNNLIDYDEILSNNKYVFNHLYLITLNDNTQIKDSIIKKNNNKVLTISNNWINIDDIKNITEIKK